MGEEGRGVAAAIEAQLTASLSAETGFGSSDRQLRELLAADCGNRVASMNFVMAVPVGNRVLAKHLCALVGTLLWSHRRAWLLVEPGEAVADAVGIYRRGGESGEEAIGALWERWAARFHVRLDAVVCATVAYLHDQAAGTLVRPGERETGDRGPAGARGPGPFYVVAAQTGTGGLNR